MTFTPEQQAEIERLADVRAARLISQALHGAAERIAAAITVEQVVLLPLVHIADIAGIKRAASPGKAGPVSAQVIS